MYAHKLSTYSDDAHKPVVYCSVCGHESNLSAPCPGEYVLSEKEQKHIDDCFKADMIKIFS